MYISRSDYGSIFPDSNENCIALNILSSIVFDVCFIEVCNATWMRTEVLFCEV
jgi:hypothetical protein